MHLLRLPNELLQKIIVLGIPESFENLALTCKQLHDASRIFLTDHNAKRKRFRHFRYSTDESSASEDARHTKGDVKIQNVLELLQYIAHHPIVARYMVTADLSNDSLGSSWYDAEDVEKPLIKGPKTKLFRLLQESPYLARRQHDPAVWLDVMDQRLDGHADIFLLTLLPNVTQLIISDRTVDMAIPDHEEYDQETLDDTQDPISKRGRQLLDDIAERANSEPISEAALSRLQIIENNCDSDYDTKNNLTGVAALLSIRSVRRFFGRSFVALEDGYTGIEFYPKQERFSPNLEEFILEDSLLGAKTSRRLFSRIENLRVFRLSWDIKYHGCGSHWDVGAMIYFLQEAAGGTLEELSLHVNESLNSMGIVPPDMAGFTRLKFLDIEHDMLRGSPFDTKKADKVTDEEDYDSTSEEHAASDDESAAPDDDAPWPVLVDFLPKSIERVVISEFQIKADDDPLYLFQRLAEERAVKLPCLKEIAVFSTWQNGFVQSGRGVEQLGSDMLASINETITTHVENFGGTFHTSPRSREMK